MLFDSCQFLFLFFPGAPALYFFARRCNAGVGNAAIVLVSLIFMPRGTGHSAPDRFHLVEYHIVGCAFTKAGSKNSG